LDYNTLDAMKVGVIGIGSMGINHVRVYADMGVLEGVTDVSRASGESVSKRFSTEFFEDAQQLLKNVDAVSISTPTSTHREMVRMAIENGVNILVEKPFTGDPKIAEELCLEAEKEHLVLSVGMVERHNPVVGAAKQRLQDKDFGNLITFTSRRVSSMPERIRDVGVIMDLGIHDVDVFNYLCGSPVKSVYTIGGSANGTGFEDHANIILEAENGVKGVIEINWLTPMKVRSVSLTCSKLFAEFDYMDQSIATSSSRYSNPEDSSFCFGSPWEFDYRKFSVKKAEPLKRELSDFVSAVRDGHQPLVSGREVLNDLRVCKAALRSLQERRMVSL